MITRNGDLSSPVYEDQFYRTSNMEDVSKNYLALDEDMETDKPMNPKLKMGLMGAGLLFAIAFSITAFVKDFQRAIGLFWIEVAIVVLFGFKVGYAVVADQANTTFATVESAVNRFRSIKVVQIALGVITACLMIGIAIWCSYEEPERLIAGAGLIVLVLFCYAWSWKRTQIKWRPVISGFLIQFVFALFILRTNAGFQLFDFLGTQTAILLNYTNEGASFLFGYLAAGIPDAEIDALQFGVFAFSVLPTIIFFSSIVSILYYFGVIQAIIQVLGGALAYIMDTSASESLSAAGNIFVGQTEAPLLVRPFLKDMTKSELHAIMTGGFATIAGGVMAIYISFGVDASNLLAASVMSAPAALAISKIMYPETEQSPTASGKVIKIDAGDETNVIDAASNGASIAVQLVLNIAGMLVAFIAIVAMLDNWFGYLGNLVDWQNASFTATCGYLFYPIAFLMGVPTSECLQVGQLIGTKIFVNEFVAYLQLQAATGLSQRTQVICTYALCGFSNFASIGIQLGALGAMAPNRKRDLAKLVFSAMIAGNVACFATACIAGLLYDPSAL